MSSPVVLASVGTYSGPAASSAKPNLDGAQIWVKWINGHGGLHGHEVKLLVYDDAGDPARHRFQLQEAIEQRHAIAFFASGEAITGASSSDYIASKRVPVIGADGGEEHAYSNPLYFVPHAVGLALDRTFLLSSAQQMVPTGNTKLATVTCVEAQACSDTNKIFAEEAGKQGFQVVSQARASIAQPDFTAECLAARNAGAETFFVMLDSNSISRLTTAWSARGTTPSSRPAPNTVAGSPSVWGWPRVGRTASCWSGPASTCRSPRHRRRVLAGLWTVRNDTLGGLTYPLTFVKDQPAARKACWFNVAIKDHSWASPDGYALHCAS